jgi:hypothetical protein
MFEWFISNTLRCLVGENAAHQEKALAMQRLGIGTSGNVLDISQALKC